MKRLQWKHEIWDISKLKPYDKNPRIITEFGLDQLKGSFDDIGVAQPTNINTDGTILSGHARYRQLLREKAKKIAVYVPDRKLTPKQEESVIIRMNKTTAGKWDFNILSNSFELDDLLDYGFTMDELNINPDLIEKINRGDENSEWVGLPEFNPIEQRFKLIISFNTEAEIASFVKENDIKITTRSNKTWSTSFQEKSK